MQRDHKQSVKTKIISRIPKYPTFCCFTWHKKSRNCKKKEEEGGGGGRENQRTGSLHFWVLEGPDLERKIDQIYDKIIFTVLDFRQENCSIERQVSQQVSSAITQVCCVKMDVEWLKIRKYSDLWEKK